MCVCVYTLSASHNDKSLLVSSVGQYSAHNVTGGSRAMDGYLSTAADLTKQVRPSFALPAPPPWGSRGR